MKKPIEKAYAGAQPGNTNASVWDGPTTQLGVVMPAEWAQFWRIKAKQDMRSLSQTLAIVLDPAKQGK